MEQTENPTGATDNSAVEELQNEVQAFRTLLSVSLVLLIVLSFCVNVALFKQASEMNKQRSAAQQNAAMFRQQALEVWAKLSDFGKTHADVMPILDRYRPFILSISGTNAATPAPQK